LKVDFVCWIQSEFGSRPIMCVYNIYLHHRRWENCSLLAWRCAKGPIRLWHLTYSRLQLERTAPSLKSFRMTAGSALFHASTLPYSCHSTSSYGTLLQPHIFCLEHPDSISWTWTDYSIYSTSSAYRDQFHGSYSTFEMQKIWSAHVVPNCKFFSWLALHGKVMRLICWPSEAGRTTLPASFACAHVRHIPTNYVMVKAMT
jgi:hypothetical protein